MKILAIETSCDETSIAIIEKINSKDNGIDTDINLSLNNSSVYKVLAHNTISQINVHAQYGGVYPSLARREHEKNLIPLLHKSLSDASMLNLRHAPVEEKVFVGEVAELMERYIILSENLADFHAKFEISQIDAIAVTSGPGLPPALWVGVNFAKAIASLYNIKSIYPINHMEGHIIAGISNLITKEVVVSKYSEYLNIEFKGESENNIFYEVIKPDYPVLSLLISGGHTELVMSERENHYIKIGETKDDAVGESFDKVARMLGLPYPGGPEVSRLAKIYRAKSLGKETVNYLPKPFPRPMIHSGDLNFSFSGLKTHILYLIRDHKKQSQEKLSLLNPSLNATLEHSGSLKDNLSKTSVDIDEEMKMQIAAEFEEAVKDVFVKKLETAIEKYNIQTLIVGGGVASNDYLREHITLLADRLNVKLHISSKILSTDNALMIALTAGKHIENKIAPNNLFLAKGSLSF